jgi:26S proteasome regulatory subunit N1
MNEINNRPLRRQLAFLLARNQIWFNPGPDESNEIDDCLRNLSLSNHFIHLATELSVKDPKSPEDIYKSHLENTRSGLTGGVDSARMNLASTFVSGFVNAGMKEDKLGMTGKQIEKDGETVFESGGSWIWKNKDMGMLSATASLGWLYLWDAEDSINHIDSFVYAEDVNIQVKYLFPHTETNYRPAHF